MKAQLDCSAGFQPADSGEERDGHELRSGRRKPLNKVAIEFTGYVEVANDGIYLFSSSSDDGSKLFLDDPPPPRLEVVGSSPLLAPRSIVISQNLPEQEDNHWSEVEGTVTFVCKHQTGASWS